MPSFQFDAPSEEVALDSSSPPFSHPSHESRGPNPPQLSIPSNPHGDLHFAMTWPLEAHSPSFAVSELGCPQLGQGTYKAENRTSFPLEYPSALDYESHLANHSPFLDDDTLVTYADHVKNLSFFPPLHGPHPHEFSISPSSSRPCTAGYDTSLDLAFERSQVKVVHPTAHHDTKGSFSLTATRSPSSPPSLLTATKDVTPSPFFDLPLEPYAAFSRLCSPPLPQALQIQPDFNDSSSPHVAFLENFSQPLQSMGSQNQCALEPSLVNSPDRKPPPWSSALAGSLRSRGGSPMAYDEAVPSHSIPPNTMISVASAVKGENGHMHRSCGQGGGALLVTGAWDPVMTAAQDSGIPQKLVDQHPQDPCQSTLGNRKGFKNRSSIQPRPSKCSGDPTLGLQPQAEFIPTVGDITKEPDGSRTRFTLPPPRFPETHARKACSRAFVCNYISPETFCKCNKKFQRQEHLKRHYATHRNEKPFPCDICGQYFGRTDNLKQHEKTHLNYHGRNSKLLRAKLEKERDGKPSKENRRRTSLRGKS